MKCPKSEIGMDCCSCSVCCACNRKRITSEAVPLPRHYLPTVGAYFMPKVKEAMVYALIQMGAYFLLVTNTRAIAAGSKPMALASDAVYASFNFFVIRKIAKSENSTPGFIGYVIGSLIGTYVGMSL